LQAKQKPLRAKKSAISSCHASMNPIFS